MSRRRSKWDVSASEVATENTNGSSKSASDAAKERAAKLTAMLAAKGKLANNVGAPLPSMSAAAAALSAQKNDKEQDLLYAEVEINDSPARFILCKGTTQDEINKYSGAAVSTKGRYMDAEEKKMTDKDGERPLYLFVQAASQDKIELALKRIREIMKGPDIYSKPPTEQASSHTRWSPYQPTNSMANNSFISNTAPISQPQNQTLPTGMHYIQDKVFVGLEQSSPEFNVKEKLLGPGGSYFQHICTETGAKVFLRGKGSGFLEPTSGREAFEALHIYISHTKQDGLSAARKLVENLIQTVNQEYQNFEQRKREIPPGYPPHPGYQQFGYMHPYAYPPGMQQPPAGYPPQPVGPPAPYYGHHPPPVPPRPPIPAHGPMILPPGYGAPSPQQQAHPYPDPPLPAGPPSAGPTSYPPPNVPYPPRPDAPPAVYTGPPQPTPPPVPPTPPRNEPPPPLPEDNELSKRDQVAPPANPQPDFRKRRFQEAPCIEPPQPQQRTSLKESSREASYLGTKQERKSQPNPQQLPKKDRIQSMPPPPRPPSDILMPPPKLKQPKTSDQKDFKKPLGLSKPFTPPLPPKMILGKQQSQKPSNPGTKKQGLPSPADSPEPKKTKKEEPREASLSTIGSLVAYEGDSSEEEEDEEQPVPNQSSKQIEDRSTSRSKKQQNLPFWAVRN